MEVTFTDLKGKIPNSGRRTVALYIGKKLVARPQFKRLLLHNDHNCYCRAKLTSAKYHNGITSSYATPNRHDTSQPVRYKITVKLSYKRSSVGYIDSLVHK